MSPAISLHVMVLGCGKSPFGRVEDDVLKREVTVLSPSFTGKD